MIQRWCNTTVPRIHATYVICDATPSRRLAFGSFEDASPLHRAAYCAMCDVPDRREEKCPIPTPTLGLKIPLRGGGGGLGEMGFRAGPFVLRKNRCWHQNTNFGSKSFFSPIPPPHMCSQNNQRDVGIILSHDCWARPPPPWHSR